MNIFKTKIIKRFVVAVEKIANALDRKTEPKAHTTWTSGVVWTEDAINSEPKAYTTWASSDEPQTERIKTLDYCDICNHKGCDNCIANSLDDYCVPSNYTPNDDTPQTEQTDCPWK